MQPVDFAGFDALLNGAGAVSEPLTDGVSVSTASDIPDFFDSIAQYARAVMAQGTPVEMAEPQAANAAAADSEPEATSQQVSSQDSLHTGTAEIVYTPASMQADLPPPPSSPMDAHDLAKAAILAETPVLQPAAPAPATDAASDQDTGAGGTEPPLMQVHTVTVSPVDGDGTSHDAPILQVETVDQLAGTVIDGTFLNGGETSAPPILAESLPAALRPEVAADAPNADATSGASFVVEAQDAGTEMTVHAGGNLLANDVKLVNAGVTATQVAVAGDYHRIDAIVQTNAYADDDHFDGLFPGASAAATATTTQSVNLASFEHEVQDSAAATATENPGLFPTNWQISVVQGDMIFLDWIQQYSFTSDNDRHVLTATGTHTTVTTGENIGLDQVSFQNIGNHYDLMLIGGDLYDGNVIRQTNILFDNDSLATFGSSGDASGTLSTSGNLLWNQASITNVGATDWLNGLPQDYKDAMGSIDQGSYAMPDGLQSDQGFEGVGLLRVLYVAGSVYDLHYANQVNVLSDADQVALYKDQLLADSPETVWDVSTGGNALINSASITDYDDFGSKAHYGGSIYSDATLVQAEIVQSAHPDALPTGDALATEIVAFLHDDADAPPPGDDDYHPTPVHIDHPASFDAMHAILA
jgi:hypothetical protein